jgi:hypothetical protein
MVALSVGTACFTYVPVATEAAPAGTDVRVGLTTAGSTQLAQSLGARVVSMDGKLASSPADSAVKIAAQWVQTAEGVRQPWTGTPTITLPRSYLMDVQKRAIDRRKSTIAAIALAGSVAVIGAVVMRGGSSEGSRETGVGTGLFRR